MDKHLLSAAVKRGTLSYMDRFWSKVDKRGPDDCWEWTAYRAHFGHGRIRIDGISEGSHRVAWELTHGPIPEGMCVLHACDNPPCCNPSHLWLGTQSENIKDMYRKKRGRELHGEAINTAKLTAAEVTTMRALNTKGFSYSRLGREYGVTKQNARHICLRITWKHVK